jgi:hypothetical protein
MSYARLPLLLSLLLAAAAASAQPADIQWPPPALDRLALLVGTWTLRDLPPDETYRQTCGWVGDRRHVVCQERHERPERSGSTYESAYVYTYVQADSTLRLYSFAGRGDATTMTGRVEGEGFVFWGEDGTESFPVQTRMTITPTGEGYEVLAEMATGGEPWVEAARFGYVRLE